MSHSKSGVTPTPFLNAEMGSMLALQQQLETIAREAESTVVCTQPRLTRTKLTTQARSIFRNYAEHGSQQRLRQSIKAFLEKGHEGLDFADASATVHQEHVVRPRRRPQIQQGQDDGDDDDAGNGTGEREGEGRMVDPESAELVQTLPFHIDCHFTAVPDVLLPTELMGNIDRIFGLFAAEARMLLSHHCDKYGAEAVLRSGVRELIMR